MRGSEKQISWASEIVENLNEVKQEEKKMTHTAEETKTMNNLIAAYEAAIEKNGAGSNFYSAETQKTFADMWAYAEAHKFVNENGTISVEA